MGVIYEIITVFPSKTTFCLSSEEMYLIYLGTLGSQKQYTIFWCICQECLVFTIYSSCDAHFFEKVLTLYDAIQPQALSHKIIQFSSFSQKFSVLTSYISQKRCIWYNFLITKITISDLDIDQASHILPRCLLRFEFQLPDPKHNFGHLDQK